MKKGKLIVFDGVDGSGKATQAKLLISRLNQEKIKAVKIDFPQYGQKSAGMIEEYLTGKYGDANSLTAYQASILYACDRFDASFKMRQWLNEGQVIVADRYLSSNIGHQGGKIRNKKERVKYYKWLFDLEYDLFKIPKPDKIFILKTNPNVGFKTISGITDKEKLEKREKYLGGKKDIHETDKTHLVHALDSYLEASKLWPRDFKVIECMDKGTLLPPSVIHERVWQEVKKLWK